MKELKEKEKERVRWGVGGLGGMLKRNEKKN